MALSEQLPIEFMPGDGCHSSSARDMPRVSWRRRLLSSSSWAMNDATSGER